MAKEKHLPPPIKVNMKNIIKMLNMCGFETDEGFIHLFIELMQLDISKGNKTTLKDITELQVKLDIIYKNEK